MTRRRSDRSPRPFRDDERGVAVIVGALLLTSLVVATLVTVRVQFQPVWQQDREARHMDLVARQLVEATSELQHQIDNDSNVPVSLPLTMGGGAGSLRGQIAQGEAAFTPAPATSPALRIESNRLTILRNNGTLVTGGSESWTSISGSTSVTQLGTIESLRIRLASVSTGHDGDSVTLTLTDKNNAFAGDFRVYVTTYPSGYDVNVRTRSASGETLVDQSSGNFRQNPQSPMWIDTLREDFRWRNVVNGAARPLALSLVTANVNSGGNNQDLSAEYAITYSKIVNGQTVLVGGGGAAVPNYRADYRGGTLTFVRPNTYFVDQTFLVENGALVLAQPQGAAFRVEPAFAISMVGNTTAVTFASPTALGAAQTLSTRGTGTVQLSGTSGIALAAVAPRLVITVPTQHPALWASFFAAECAAAGIPTSQCSTATGANSVVLTLLGVNTTPTSTYDDIALDFRQGFVQLALRG